MLNLDKSYFICDGVSKAELFAQCYDLFKEEDEDSPKKNNNIFTVDTGKSIKTSPTSTEKVRANTSNWQIMELRYTSKVTSRWLQVSGLVTITDKGIEKEYHFHADYNVETHKGTVRFSE